MKSNKMELYWPPAEKSKCTELVTSMYHLLYLPRRPRDSQSGREKRRDERFSSMGKRAPRYRLSSNYFQKIQADAGSWLGTKNALYYCAQSANSFSWFLFASSPDPTDCPWVSKDADEPTLLFVNLTKGFVQIFESKIRNVLQNNISFSGLK